MPRRLVPAHVLTRLALRPVRDGSRWSRWSGRRLGLLLGPIAALSLCVGDVLAEGSPLEKGIAAYSRGDYRTAFEAWLEDAENGDPQAQWLVGNMILRGQADGLPGVSGSAASQAAVFYRQSARQGYTEAQVSLGLLMLKGQVGPADDETALALLYEAAAKNHPVAQMELGDLFLYGIRDRIPADHVHALDWYLKAARQNVVLAQFQVAQLYLEGVGTVKDEAEGLAWLILARERVKSGQEAVWSKRVMPLGQQVRTDPEKRTLGQLVAATHEALTAALPDHIIREARRKAQAKDRSGG